MKIKLILLLLIMTGFTVCSQNWNGSSTVSTTSSDYNTSIQLTQIGWGSHHGILFNANRSASLVNGPLFGIGNTKHSFDVGPYGSGAGAIMYLGNGGRMDFLISGSSSGAGTDVDWGAPKLTISRTGVGVGSDDPQSTLEVKKLGVTIGQTVNVAHFTIAGENHFEQPGVYTEGKLVLGTKAYGNGILRRAEIGYSTSGTWRGGMLKFYTTPDDDTWVPLQRMVINQNGNVGIGTTAPGSYRLAVEGKIGAREVNVTTANPWPDYVFDNDYPLQPLEQVDAYIKENKHLPGVPSEAEVLKNGQDLGAMNAVLLKKVEELTIYVIDQRKEIDELKAHSVSPDTSGKKMEELMLYVVELKKENLAQNKMIQELQEKK